MLRPSNASRPREVTGRTVLLAFIAFFGVVFAANAILVRAATSTFGGVETASSYKAGLAFRQETDAARAQDALGWNVQASLTRQSDDVTIEATVRDALGNIPAGLTAVARLAHPADARHDKVVALDESGGRFRGIADLPPGQWDLIVDFSRDGERTFRSRSRIMVK
ncbi:MAG: FixH family protein [Pseudorhodoplanes sp.]|jgi:nitrogen fixation protein FixH|nr:FixH family protein [Pseudorhodoplanes sp.]